MYSKLVIQFSIPSMCRYEQKITNHNDDIRYLTAYSL